MSIERAIAFAAQAHEGQLDKSGVPYIYHPLRVMEAVRHLGDTYARVAVLHDVVEDCEYSELEVQDAVGLNARELVALVLVTRHDQDTYREFITDIAKYEALPAGKIAKAIKIADIKDNLGRLTPELKGMEKRYKMALEILGEPYSSVFPALRVNSLLFSLIGKSRLTKAEASQIIDQIKSNMA